MKKLAAFTKIILAVAISLASLVSLNIYVLFILTTLEVVMLLITDKLNKTVKTILFMSAFAAFLYAVQLLCGTVHSLALASSLRMLIMSFSVIILLATTRTQEITAALVKQCKLPFSYAFMVTAVLRFVPDLLSESQAVREAQMCRGYSPSKNPVKKLYDSMAVIKPMVFKAIERSDSMAISLEMRGFTQIKNRTYMSQTYLKAVDYFVIVFFIGFCYALVKLIK